MPHVDDFVWVAHPSGWRIQQKSSIDHPRAYRGWVETKLGIVTVEQWVWVRRGGAVAAFDFVHKGFHMRRRMDLKKPYSRRYLVTLARRFAEEVVYGIHV
jgi:hypothetical protein